MGRDFLEAFQCAQEIKTGDVAARAKLKSQYRFRSKPGSCTVNIITTGGKGASETHAQAEECVFFFSFFFLF